MMTTANSAQIGRPWSPSTMLATLAIFLTLQPSTIDAFIATTIPAQSPINNPPIGRDSTTTLHLARKYIVIGGNIDGINPNKEEEEDTYNMSKKERRRRERERGAAAFKSGAYKQKNKTMKDKFKKIDFDKLDEKVTKQRTLFPREMRNNNNNTIQQKKKLSPKAARLQKQRTAGGNITSNVETTSSNNQSPEKQAIQIRVAKRGNKTVTMVQGMTLPFKERKVLLKEMKTMLGGGGALVEGVLELQGSHSDKVLEYLKSKGYSSAKKAG